MEDTERQAIQKVWALAEVLCAAGKPLEALFCLHSLLTSSASQSGELRRELCTRSSVDGAHHHRSQPTESMQVGARCVHSAVDSDAVSGDSRTNGKRGPVVRSGALREEAAAAEDITQSTLPPYLRLEELTTRVRAAEVALLLLQSDSTRGRTRRKTRRHAHRCGRAEDGTVRSPPLPPPQQRSQQSTRLEKGKEHSSDRGEGDAPGGGGGGGTVTAGEVADIVQSSSPAQRTEEAEAEEEEDRGDEEGDDVEGEREEPSTLTPLSRAAAQEVLELAQLFLAPLFVSTHMRPGAVDDVARGSTSLDVLMDDASASAPLPASSSSVSLSVSPFIPLESISPLAWSSQSFSLFIPSTEEKEEDAERMSEPSPTLAHHPTSVVKQEADDEGNPVHHQSAAPSELSASSRDGVRATPLVRSGRHASVCDFSSSTASPRVPAALLVRAYLLQARIARRRQYYRRALQYLDAADHLLRCVCGEDKAGGSGNPKKASSDAETGGVQATEGEEGVEDDGEDGSGLTSFSSVVPRTVFSLLAELQARHNASHHLSPRGDHVEEEEERTDSAQRPSTGCAFLYALTARILERALGRLVQQEVAACRAVLSEAYCEVYHAQLLSLAASAASSSTSGVSASPSSSRTRLPRRGLSPRGEDTRFTAAATRTASSSSSTATGDVKRRLRDLATSVEKLSYHSRSYEAVRFLFTSPPTPTPATSALSSTSSYADVALWESALAARLSPLCFSSSLPSSSSSSYVPRSIRGHGGGGGGSRRLDVHATAAVLGFFHCLACVLQTQFLCTTTTTTTSESSRKQLRSFLQRRPPTPLRTEGGGETRTTSSVLAAKPTVARSAVYRTLVHFDVCDKLFASHVNREATYSARSEFALLRQFFVMGFAEDFVRALPPSAARSPNVKREVGQQADEKMEREAQDVAVASMSVPVVLSWTSPTVREALELYMTLCRLTNDPHAQQQQQLASSRSVKTAPLDATVNPKSGGNSAETGLPGPKEASTASKREGSAPRETAALPPPAESVASAPDHHQHQHHHPSAMVVSHGSPQGAVAMQPTQRTALMDRVLAQLLRSVDHSMLVLTGNAPASSMTPTAKREGNGSRSSRAFPDGECGRGVVGVHRQELPQLYSASPFSQIRLLVQVKASALLTSASYALTQLHLVRCVHLLSELVAFMGVFHRQTRSLRSELHLVLATLSMQLALRDVLPVGEGGGVSESGLPPRDGHHGGTSASAAMVGSVGEEGDNAELHLVAPAVGLPFAHLHAAAESSQRDSLLTRPAVTLLRKLLCAFALYQVVAEGKRLEVTEYTTSSTMTSAAAEADAHVPLAHSAEVSLPAMATSTSTTAVTTASVTPSSAAGPRHHSPLPPSAFVPTPLYPPSASVSAAVPTLRVAGGNGHYGPSQGGGGGSVGGSALLLSSTPSSSSVSSVGPPHPSPSSAPMGHRGRHGAIPPEMKRIRLDLDSGRGATGSADHHRYQQQHLMRSPPTTTASDASFVITPVTNSGSGGTVGLASSSASTTVSPSALLSPLSSGVMTSTAYGPPSLSPATVPRGGGREGTWSREEIVMESPPLTPINVAASDRGRGSGGVSGGAEERAWRQREGDRGCVVSHHDDDVPPHRGPNHRSNSGGEKELALREIDPAERRRCGVVLANQMESLHTSYTTFTDLEQACAAVSSAFPAQTGDGGASTDTGRGEEADLNPSHQLTLLQAAWTPSNLILYRLLSGLVALTEHHDEPAAMTHFKAATHLAKKRHGLLSPFVADGMQWLSTASTRYHGDIDPSPALSTTTTATTAKGDASGTSKVNEAHRTAAIALHVALRCSNTALFHLAQHIVTGVVGTASGSLFSSTPSQTSSPQDGIGEAVAAMQAVEAWWAAQVRVLCGQRVSAEERRLVPDAPARCGELRKLLLLLPGTHSYAKWED